MLFSEAALRARQEVFRNRLCRLPQSRWVEQVLDFVIRPLRSQDLDRCAKIMTRALQKVFYWAQVSVVDAKSSGLQRRARLSS